MLHGTGGGVIFKRTCIFSTENHYGNIQGVVCIIMTPPLATKVVYLLHGMGIETGAGWGSCLPRQ